MRYTVISADCHAGLPMAEYRPYLDKQYLDAFDADLAAREELVKQKRELNKDYVEHWEEEHGEGFTGSWDSKRRDRELDADGVVGEVLFPDADAITGGASPPFGAGLLAGEVKDPALAFAGARAHNRFLAELCQDNPKRRAGVALVPITHDQDRAVEEIRWARENGLRGGILIPTMWGEFPAYHDMAYDKVWATCAELQMPVHTHSGSAPQEQYGENVGIYLAEVVWWACRPMWFLLFSGAFERHPELKYVVTESGAYWMADYLWKWDVYFGGGHTTEKMKALFAGKLSMLPSEYIDRNIFIGASTMSRTEVERRHVIGTHNLMWGNDYPHPEGAWPHTVAKLKETFFDVPVSETAEMVGGAAARVYNFDLAGLAPLAAEVGPTPDDLGQDSSVPADPEATRKARWWLSQIGR